MGSVRIGRINEELLRVLSGLLRTVRDPRVGGGIVSVTHVEAAADLGSARVYISVLGDEAVRRGCMKGLISASGYLRREAAKRLRLRYTPELIFVEDDSIVSGARVMELMDDVAKAEERRSALDAGGASEFLATRDDILILTHRSPDGDAAGSAAALCLALRAAGKRAYVYKNPEFTARLSKLVRGLYPPEGFEPRCIAAVDCADSALLAAGAEDYRDSVELAMDHHVSHRKYSQRLLLSPDSAACGEIVCDVIEAMGVKLTKRIAEALYVAIATDTGRFLHANTTAETHLKASKLLECGIDFAAINREYFVEKSRARMAVEAALTSDMEVMFGGRVGIIKLTEALIQSTGADEDDLDGLSSLPRSLSGVELGIYLRERGGSVKVSVRSGDLVDASDFCAHFGGGGHARAAGCTIEGTLTSAEERIVAYIEQLAVF